MLQRHPGLGTLFLMPGIYGYSETCQDHGTGGFPISSCSVCWSPDRWKSGSRYKGWWEGGFLFTEFLCQFLWLIAKRPYFKISWWINNLTGWWLVKFPLPLLYFYYEFGLVYEKEIGVYDIENKSWKTKKGYTINRLSNVVTTMAWLALWNWLIFELMGYGHNKAVVWYPLHPHEFLWLLSV